MRVPMPVMLACRVQLNLYVPALLGAVNVAESPLERSGVLKLPSSAVTLWAAESEFVTLTVSPAFTVTGAPNLKFWIVIVAAAVPPPPPLAAAEDGAGAGAWEGVFELLFEEQAATARAANSAATANRRSLVMLRYTEGAAERFTVPEVNFSARSTV
jgi:hypothetical protein